VSGKTEAQINKVNTHLIWSNWIWFLYQMRAEKKIE